MEIDAIKLTRLIEVAGSGNVEREAGRVGHAHPVSHLCLLSGMPEWMRNANVVDSVAES